MREPRNRTLCYVFCAIEGRATSLPEAGMPGGGPPRPLTLDEHLTLIVADVPPDAYDAASIEPRLSDLEWVGAAGAAHHAVIDALAERDVVALPFRLFTIFSSEAAALATLRETRPALAGAFDRVRGRQEWVLRIGRPDPSRVEASATAPADPRPSGTGFLRAKSKARRQSAERAERVQADAAAAYAALEALADRATSRPVDVNGTLLLDAAFLVARDRVDMLKDTLTRAANRLLNDGCPVSLTGPWPPYSFAAIDTDA